MHFPCGTCLCALHCTIHHILQLLHTLQLCTLVGDSGTPAAKAASETSETETQDETADETADGVTLEPAVTATTLVAAAVGRVIQIGYATRSDTQSACPPKNKQKPQVFSS
jgi:hypothetical protein